MDDPHDSWDELQFRLWDTCYSGIVLLAGAHYLLSDDVRRMMEARPLDESEILFIAEGPAAPMVAPLEYVRTKPEHTHPTSIFGSRRRKRW